MTDCFGSYRGTCVVLVVDANGVDEFPENAVMAELAKKYRNDPFSFVWIDGGAQAEFARAFGVKKSHAPALVAVKSGRRNRFAVMAANAGDGLDERVASAFLDKILGGDMRFEPIASLPSVEPEYLRGGDAAARGRMRRTTTPASVASRCTAARTSAGRTTGMRRRWLTSTRSSTWTTGPWRPRRM